MATAAARGAVGGRARLLTAADQYLEFGDQIRVGSGLHKEACDLLDHLWTARQSVPLVP